MQSNLKARINRNKNLIAAINVLQFSSIQLRRYSGKLDATFKKSGDKLETWSRAWELRKSMVEPWIPMKAAADLISSFD